MPPSWIENKIESLDDPGAPTTPSRVIGTPFQPSTTKYVQGFYTFELTADHGETSTITLLSDAVNPPTTARASAVLGVVDAAAKVIARQQLVYVVPPGHFVKFLAAGAPATAATLANQVEMVIS